MKSCFAAKAVVQSFVFRVRRGKVLNAGRDYNFPALIDVLGVLTWDLLTLIRALNSLLQLNGVCDFTFVECSERGLWHCQ